MLESRYMGWEDIHQRLLESLRAEVRKHWGHVAEIEDRLDCSEGYLSRLCSGRNEFRLDFFIKSIAALGLDHGSFFARALDIPPRTEDYLKQLEEPDEHDRAFPAMAAATLALEADEPPPPHPRAVADASLAADLASRPRREQMRRLRHSAKYRTHAFARSFLEHLDSLRYDDAVEAAKLTVGVATYLIPALPGPRGERLALQCFALGVFGSARRLKGDFGSASRAFRLGLEVARRASLRHETADLLMRASYLVKDFGQFDRALALLKEALAIFARLGSTRDMGRALVDHGMMSCYAGDYGAAILDLEQALRYLEGSSEELPRTHLAAFQFLAYAYEQAGDPEAAERCLARGANAFGSSHAVDRSNLASALLAQNENREAVRLAVRPDR